MFARGLGASLRPARPSSLLKTARFSSTLTPISNPTLRRLDTRWENLSELERNDLIEQLSERQKGSWKDLTPLEKRAAWYISYGEWGPRRPVHPKGSEFYIFSGVIVGLVATAALFLGIRSMAPPMSYTMSREWQEKSNELLDEVNSEPFTGHNQVQSPPTGLTAEKVEEMQNDE